MRFKHIIWDFDGTLFDTYPIMAQSLTIALEKIGINESQNDIMKNMKISMGYALKHYGKKYNLDSDFMKRYETIRYELEQDGIRPFEYIQDICKKVCENNGQNYIFTHRGVSTLVYLEKYNMKNYFTQVITSKDNFPRKPQPDAIKYLIEKYNIETEEAVMIGDRELDVMSGKNAGIYGCYLNEEKKIFDSADYNIYNIIQLYEILEIEK